MRKLIVMTSIVMIVTAASATVVQQWDFDEDGSGLASVVGDIAGQSFPAIFGDTDSVASDGGYSGSTVNGDSFLTVDFPGSFVLTDSTAVSARLIWSIAEWNFSGSSTPNFQVRLQEDDASKLVALGFRYDATTLNVEVYHTGDQLSGNRTFERLDASGTDYVIGIDLIYSNDTYTVWSGTDANVLQTGTITDLGSGNYDAGQIRATDQSLSASDTIVYDQVSLTYEGVPLPPLVLLDEIVQKYDFEEDSSGLASLDGEVGSISFPPIFGDTDTVAFDGGYSSATNGGNSFELCSFPNSVVLTDELVGRARLTWTISEWDFLSASSGNNYRVHLHGQDSDDVLLALGLRHDTIVDNIEVYHIGDQLSGTRTIDRLATIGVNYRLGVDLIYSNDTYSIWSGTDTNVLQTGTITDLGSGNCDAAQFRFNDMAVDPSSSLVYDQITLSYDPLPSSPSSLLAEWLASYSSLGSNTNLTDDADGDSFNNLTEYAFGGIPTDSGDAGNIPVCLMVNDDDESCMQYVYFMYTDAADRGLSYNIGTDTDLVSAPGFTNAFFEVTGTNFDTGIPGFIAVTNRMVMDVDQRFIQLEVEYTP